jgi:hypothetical protein
VSKLLKLKAWLTLEDAAKHLSIMFGEPVAKADILRLALDDALDLSVNLVNGAEARAGGIIPLGKAKFTMMPKDLKAASCVESFDDYKGPFIKVVHGVQLNTGEVIDLADEVHSLRGIFDLPMIGNERLDVEHKYQLLTGGPAVTLQGLDGAFLTDGQGTYFQLQESYEENEYQVGSLASGRALELRIATEGIDADAAAQLRAKHLTYRKGFKKERAERPREEGFFPAGGLPADSVLVVRTDALLKLQQASSAADAPSRPVPELGSRERDTLLKLVIGMAVAGYSYAPTAARSEVPAEIASDLAKQGISVTDDTVRKWLKTAAAAVLAGAPNKA